MKRRRPPDWARKKRTPAGANYEVGFCRPPKHTQFKQGHKSKGGRPKGAKNRRPLLAHDMLQETVLAEAERRMKLTEAGRTITLSVLQAAVRATALGAVKGHPLAQRSFVKMVAEAERAKNDEDEYYVNAVLGYKAHCEAELEKRSVLNISGPELIPHPDDIIIDARLGEIIINGPLTADEKPRWDRLRAKKAEFEESVAELRTLAAEAEDEDYRAFLTELADEEEELRDMFSAALNRMAHSWR